MSMQKKHSSQRHDALLDFENHLQLFETSQISAKTQSQTSVWQSTNSRNPDPGLAPVIHIVIPKEED